jgi:hypothetical protein
MSHPAQLRPIAPIAVGAGAGLTNVLPIFLDLNFIDEVRLFINNSTAGGLIVRVTIAGGAVIEVSVAARTTTLVLDDVPCRGVGAALSIAVSEAGAAAGLVAFGSFVRT